MRQHYKVSKNLRLLFAAVFSTIVLTIAAAAVEVVPLGKAVGIKIFYEGVYVTNLQEIDTDTGAALPAKDAKLLKGDQILMVDGQEITSNNEMKNAIENSENEWVELQVKRGEDIFFLQIKPAVSAETGTRKIGAYVRDSMAGIGTVTFVDPKTNVFVALGHGISDSETKERVNIVTGAVMNVSITDIIKSAPGRAGELKGDFHGKDIGTVERNEGAGIFGKITVNNLDALPLAEATSEGAKTGPATILSNVDGDIVDEFTITIDKINQGDNERNFTITITDPRLIDKTGGIVQGMSGSPIIQDGKLVGAVTHVLVNDTQKGYGIFIEKMLS